MKSVRKRRFTSPEKSKKQAVFLIIFLILLVSEFAIGIFLHGGFIRSYFGDVLIVLLLYAFVRIFVPDRFWLLGVSVLLFSVLVEFTQRIPLVDILGIENRFIRTLMGTSFSWWDIVCYVVGFLFTVPYDLYLYRIRKET